MEGVRLHELQPSHGDTQIVAAVWLGVSAAFLYETASSWLTRPFRWLWTEPLSNGLYYKARQRLEPFEQMQVIVDEHDPAIGFLHTHSVVRPPLVFDLMEPQRPIVEQG
jgi:hypothetical protein